MRTCLIRCGKWKRTIIRRSSKRRANPPARSANARTRATATTKTSSGPMELISTPLLPEGFKIPASRHEDPSRRLRRLLATKPFVFAPGVYDPFGADLAMYHRVDAVYFSGYSFAIGRLGSTDRDIYSSVWIADGPR